MDLSLLLVPSFLIMETLMSYWGKILKILKPTEKYVKGKSKWQPIELTLYDPVVPSAAQQVMEWVRTHFESVSGRGGYADFYKRDCQLKLLDPVGTVVELWDIPCVSIYFTQYILYFTQCILFEIFRFTVTLKDN